MDDPKQDTKEEALAALGGLGAGGGTGDKSGGDDQPKSIVGGTAKDTPDTEVCVGRVGDEKKTDTTTADTTEEDAPVSKKQKVGEVISPEAKVTKATSKVKESANDADDCSEPPECGCGCGLEGEICCYNCNSPFHHKCYVVTREWGKVSVLCAKCNPGHNTTGCYEQFGCRHERCGLCNNLLLEADDENKCDRCGKMDLCNSCTTVCGKCEDSICDKCSSNESGGYPGWHNEVSYCDHCQKHTCGKCGGDEQFNLYPHLPGSFDPACLECFESHEKMMSESKWCEICGWMLKDEECDGGICVRCDKG